MTAKKNKLKKKRINIEKSRKMNSRLLVVLSFFIGVLLIISTYAWFSVALDVRVHFLDLTVSSDSGLFISLDGVEFSNAVEISRETVITELYDTYPNHTNQWASAGLWPVSTIGIEDSNNDKFTMYAGEVVQYRGRRWAPDVVYLNTGYIDESRPSSSNLYIAFDLFLKNVSGSPFSDNLYLDEGTFVDFEEDTTDDIIESMTDIMNSMRIGFVKVGSVPLDADVNAIQNMTCNNNCEMVIYEPNSTSHTEIAIDRALDYYNVVMVDGEYVPTYAVINEGRFLDLETGHEGSGLPLDTEHFALQETITDFDEPIFQLPSAVTKLRTYIWIEGQDLDSLEANSDGAAIYIAINLIKDLAGYEAEHE